MPEPLEISESAYSHRVEFSPGARDVIRQKDEENERLLMLVAELQRKNTELSQALAHEAQRHGGTMKVRDEALIKGGKDPLTETFNREEGQIRAEALLKQAAEGKIKFVLVRLDIDSFKQINDANGHLWGDKVLRFVTGKIDHIKRDSDVLSRYGGEEFDTAFPFPPDTTIEDIGKVMNRYLGALYEFSRNDPKSLNPKEKLTASFGVALVESGESFNFETVSQVADDALYVAKQNGKNQVQISYARDAGIIKTDRKYIHPTM